MNEIITFTDDRFGALRQVTIDNEPWFVAKDVAEMLGYKRPSKAVLDHVEPTDKQTFPIRDSLNRTQYQTIINESGLYSLVLSSKLEQAQDFKQWITSEVLPSIRQTGQYQIGGQNNVPSPEDDQKLLAEAVLKANHLLEIKEKELEEVRPKAHSWDRTVRNKALMTITDMAKYLDIRRSELIDWCVANDVFYFDSTYSRHYPYCEFIDNGFFELCGGCCYKLTPKGREALIQCMRGELKDMLDYKI